MERIQTESHALAIRFIELGLGSTHTEVEYFNEEALKVPYYDVPRFYLGGFKIYRSTDGYINDVEMIVNGRTIELGRTTIQYVDWNNKNDYTELYALALTIAK